MKLRIRIFLPLLVSFFLVADCGWCLPPAPYSDTEMTVALGMMLRNITVSNDLPKKDHLGRIYMAGAVIASPSYQLHPAWFKGNHNYERVWVRDSALTISAIADIYQESIPGKHTLRDPSTLWGIEKYDVPAIFHSYLTFTNAIQNSIEGRYCDNPASEYALAVFGVDGSSECWSSQDDGPALRALTVMKIIELISPSSIRLPLYVSNMGCDGMGILKRDLCYITKSWNYTTHDLWEEVKDFFFFTSSMQHEALIKGIHYIDLNNDNSFKDEVATALNGINTKLGEFKNSNTCNMTYFSHWARDGECPKPRSQCPSYNDESCLNISTILAFLHTDNLKFPIDGPESLQNADAVRKIFCSESCSEGRSRPLIRYRIDSEGKCLYLGRYPSDCYDGACDKISNPWVLSNHAMAQFYYKLARTLLAKQSISLQQPSLPFYEFILPPEVFARMTAPLKASQVAQNDRMIVRHVAEKLTVEGDRLVAAVKALFPGPVVVDGRSSWLPEQINSEKGGPWSAQDLTWSYASLLTAMLERKKLEAALK